MITETSEKENETMNTSAKSTQIESHVRHQTPGLAAKVGQFLWHLVQMILAMTAFMLFRLHEHAHGGHEQACHTV
jgi:hypothetical protein